MFPTSAVRPSESLERALGWCALRPLPVRRLGTSVLVHAAVMLPLLMVGGWTLPENDDRSAGATSIPIFAPEPAATHPAAAREESVLKNLAAPVESQEGQAPEVTAELSSIKLSFAADVDNQLPEVVRQQHGMLALLDKNDTGVARYLIRPPDWEIEETITDVSGKLRIMMDPARKWKTFREIGARHGIALDRYHACAIFDIGYRRCLLEAIRGRSAAQKRPEAASYVAAARLAFAASKPCGIEVLEVSLETSPAHRP